MPHQYSSLPFGVVLEQPGVGAVRDPHRCSSARDDDVVREAEVGPGVEMRAVGVEDLDAAGCRDRRRRRVRCGRRRCRAGRVNCPGPLPCVPHCLTNLPFLSNLATRELRRPSATSIEPSGRNADVLRRAEVRLVVARDVAFSPSVITQLLAVVGELVDLTWRESLTTQTWRSGSYGLILTLCGPPRALRTACPTGSTPRSPCRCRRRRGGSSASRPSARSRARRASPRCR